MQIQITLAGNTYQCDLADAWDISIPLIPNRIGVNCFYAPAPSAEPVVAGSFIGSTLRGGSVNFMNLRINPHGNGTHTECVGHIATEPYSVQDALQRSHFAAMVASVYPRMLENGDRVVDEDLLDDLQIEPGVEALVLRTLPNTPDKLTRVYSGTNPPYLTASAVRKIRSWGIRHLLLDLPSLDREEDGGALAAHKAFWDYPEDPKTQHTVTELIYVPDEINDGVYLLNIQLCPLVLDASPSKPVLYRLARVE